MEQTATPRARGTRASLPLVLGILAAVSCVPTFLIPALRGDAAPPAAAPPAPLGRKGVNPTDVADISIATWDATVSLSRVLEVKRDGNAWVIPSRWNYPAEGSDRVFKISAGFLGVPKGRLVTDKEADYADLGLIDPLNPPTGAKTGFGKRVTLKDKTGAIVLDLIVGNRDATSEGQVFIREVDQREVWTAQVQDEISTKFTDYVEPDPFKISSGDVRSVAVVEYKLDIDRSAISPGPVTKVARAGATGDWRSPQAPENKRPAASQVEQILTALSGLKIQGIRQFDLDRLKNCGFYLGNTPEMFQIPNALTVQIEGKPFALFGTEGRLDVTTKDGLRYSFMFGKVAASADEEAGAKAPEKGAASDGPHRFLSVFVTYDAALDEEAKADKDKKDPAPAVTKKKPTGKERAAKAQERYQRFFYVISDADFKNLRPEVAKLWEDKPKEPMAGNTGKTVQQWMTDNGHLPGVNTLPSGLQYQILSSGAADGPKPGPEDTVEVSYRGTLVDGTEFDANEKTSFAVTGVIKGWTEVLQLMHPGDKWKIFVPPELGYGEAGHPPKIGQHQILIFEIGLTSIAGKAEAPKAEAPKAEAKPTEPTGK